MNFDFNEFEQTIINEIKPLLNDKAELYIVGGFVRDKLLKKNSCDIDFIVKGQSATALAETFANKTERYFVMLDDEHEIARVVDKDKLHYFDFARCENDDIEHDLSRRDLTVNALAVRVLPSLEFVDKFGGEKDITGKLIKAISEKNLTDDPLRILRIFRFASLLDFGIELETLNFANKHVKLLKDVAQERILCELLKLFEGKHSAKYIDLMKQNGLLYEIFEILKKEAEVPPNTHHHLSLIDHSIETIKQVEIKIEESPVFVKEILNSCHSQCVKRLSLLKLACLLHDVGKYDTWTIEENGRHRFINHDSVGAELLKPILKKMKFSKTQIKYITTLVKNHIYPSQLARENEEASMKPIMRMFRKLDDYTPDTLLLAMADRLSAQGPAITREITEKNISTLKKYLLLYKDFKETIKPLPKLIDGNEIAEILHIEKGKKLGEIITAIKNAQMSGEINTKEDATEFIKKLPI